MDKQKKSNTLIYYLAPFITLIVLGLFLLILAIAPLVLAYFVLNMIFGLFRKKPMNMKIEKNKNGFMKEAFAFKKNFMDNEKNNN